MASGLPPERRVLADRYRILEPLGGRGHAYKAHDLRERRVVVLRLLPPSSEINPPAIAAFRRAIRAASRLEHPNLAAVLGEGEDGGVRFVVSRYVEGIDLGRSIRDRGPMPLFQAVDCVIQAARGLEAAHGLGIVHGRLDPSEVVLDAGGVVRVLGLGLGRWPATVGADDPGRSDPRADIDSLGVLLFFLLTGERGRSAETLRIRRPDVPSTLADACRRMMAEAPDDRPASITEVIGLLEAVEAAREVPTTSRDVAGRVGRTGPPIGPEFSLEGTGIEPDRPPARGASPTDRVRSPIGVRLTVSAHPADSVIAALDRFGRPATILGLAAVAAVSILAAYMAMRPGGRTTEPDGPPPTPREPIGAVGVDREAAAKPPPPSRPEWTSRTLFDGKTPSGWMLADRRPLPRRSIQPDGLNPRGTGSSLVVLDQKIGDFILDLDYKLGPGGRAGVFLRVGDLDDPVNTGLEVALGGASGPAEERPGAIRGLVAPARDAQAPDGRWNHMTIAAIGPTIAVTLNGAEVSRIDLDEWTVPGRRPDGRAHRLAGVAPARLPRSGYLGFQDIIGDCWFRNIVARTPAPPPDGRLAPQGRKGSAGNSTSRRRSWNSGSGRIEASSGSSRRSVGSWNPAATARRSIRRADPAKRRRRDSARSSG